MAANIALPQGNTQPVETEHSGVSRYPAYAPSGIGLTSASAVSVSAAAARIQAESGGSELPDKS
jgi:hypothetical protein